jgi:hypothetical protein
VYAAIIELNTLPDTVRPAAEDHHFLRGVALHLVVPAVVGRVIVRRVSLELGGAGVHQPIARHEAEFFSQRANVVLGLPGQMRNLPVGEAERLGFGEQFLIHF